MKESIFLLRKNPQEFSDFALNNPEKAFFVPTDMDDDQSTKDHVFKLQLYLEEFDKKNISTSCAHILQEIIISATLKTYFSHCIEKSKEDYFDEKMKASYEKLSCQKFFDFHQQAKLNNLMGYIYILDQHFLQAGRYYQKAIELEQKYENISYVDLKKYFIQLASSYLMYNDKFCPEYDNGIVRKNCKKSIKSIKAAFELAKISDEDKIDLWAVFIRANDGLTTANYHIAQYHYKDAKSRYFTDKKMAYNKAIQFSIDAIFASMDVLKIDFISDNVKKIFLSKIKSSSLLITQILKNFHHQGYTSFKIPSAEQKISMNLCVSFMKNYLETTELHPKTIITLKKIIHLYEEEPTLQPVHLNSNLAEFWQPARLKNNSLSNESLSNPADEENNNLFPKTY